MEALILGIALLANGVFCEINDVRLFAKTAVECVEAGGVVTHAVNTEVTEVETDME